MIIRIRQYFNENNLDYKVWINEYRKKSQPRNVFDKDFVDNIITMYEDIGSLSEVMNNLDRPKDYSTMVERIKERLDDRGINYKNWLEENKQSKYSSQDVREWKWLYEKIGSFTEVSNYWGNQCGIYPDPKTIKKNIEDLFENVSDKKDFNKWVQKFKKRKAYYTEKEISSWRKLYEQFGNYLDVEDYLKNKYGEGPTIETISKHIKTLLDKQNIDYENWHSKYGRESSTRFKKIYSDEEVKNWIKLFENYGTFSKVSDILRKRGSGPYPGDVSRRIKELFKKEGLDYETWIFEFFNPSNARISSIGDFAHNIAKIWFIDYIVKNNLNGFL